MEMVTNVSQRFPKPKMMFSNGPKDIQVNTDQRQREKYEKML